MMTINSYVTDPVIDIYSNRKGQNNGFARNTIPVRVGCESGVKLDFGIMCSTVIAEYRKMTNASPSRSQAHNVTLIGQSMSTRRKH